MCVLDMQEGVCSGTFKCYQNFTCYNPFGETHDEEKIKSQQSGVGGTVLTQDKADTLIRTRKIRINDDSYQFPRLGEKLQIPLISEDGEERFLLDVNRGRISFSKCTYQERYQSIIILIRLDVNGSPHPNPEVVDVPLSHLELYNGITIPCPHLHLYVEGFMDKWAIPAHNVFMNTNDLYKILNDFFDYCNIIEKPNVWRMTLDDFR